MVLTGQGDDVSKTENSARFKSWKNKGTLLGTRNTLIYKYIQEKTLNLHEGNEMNWLWSYVKINEKVSVIILINMN